jgi:hypothetical protein
MSSNKKKNELPSYLGGSKNNKSSGSMPSYLNPVLRSDAIGYDGLDVQKGLKETEAKHLNEPNYKDPLSQFRKENNTDPLSKFKTQSNDKWDTEKLKAYNSSRNPTATYNFPLETKKGDLIPSPLTQSKNIFQQNAELKKNILSKPIIQPIVAKNLDLTPKALSNKKKYTLEEWDKMSFIDKVKASIEQKKLGNYDYAPREELYKQEVDQRAKSPVGAFTTGLVNSASLGTLNVGAEKQLETANKLNLNTPNLNIVKEAQKQSPISYKVGELAGYALPAGAGTKLVKPLTSKIVNPLLSRIAEGALVGGGMTAAQETFEGKPIKQIIGDTALNTALGAGIDTAIGLPAYLKGVNKNILDKAFINKFGELPEFKTKPIIEPKPIKEVAIAKPSEIIKGKFTVKNTALDKAQAKYDNAVETIHNHFMTNQLTHEEVARIKPELGIDIEKLINNVETAKTDIRSIGEKQRLAKVAGINELPTNKLQVPNLVKPSIEPKAPNIMNLDIEQGKNPTTNILIPKNIKKPLGAPTIEAPGLKPRSFPQNVAKGEITSPELQRLIEKTDINYKPITNEDTLNFAKKAIDNNYDEALNLVKSKAPATAESNTIAQLLIKKLQDEGNYTEAIEVIENVSEKATKQGRAIQALSMWGRLTPEGMLRFAQKTIDKVNNNLPDHKKIKLTEETAKDITDKMKKIAGMEEGREKTVATAEVLKKVRDQVPPTLLSKISNIQTIAQLLNGKTAIRNILGNAGFNMIENLKDVIATPLDIGLSKLTGQRTTTLPSLITQGKGFIGGLKAGFEDSVKGIDTSGVKTQFDLPQGSMFKSKFGKSIEKLLSVELKAPDRAFYQAAYDDSLRKQVKLAKVLQPTDKMIENAHLDALYKTFQDDNVVSKAFSNTKKALNLGKEFGLGDVVLKYPHVPGSILMRAVEYSPAGYAKTVIQLAKDINNKSFNQKAFVESIGRATTGTASLVGTGYILNQLGIITGQSENDYDTKEVEKTVGLGDYKLNVTALKRYIFSGFDKAEAKTQKGDTVTDYSFMQPMAIGLVIGADISQNKANPSGAVSKLVEAIGTGTDTLVEQPLMQGIRRLGGQGSASKAIMETLKGVPASFVPSILNQVRQLTDNVNRNTYDPSLGKQSINLVKNKIPGLSKSLEPRIDVLGKEKEVFQNKGNNPLNVFLNPSTVTKYQDKPAAQLPLDIFKASGEKIQMPRLVDNKITYKGTTYQLTPKELTQYQKQVGEKTKQQFEQKKSWLNSPNKPEEKAKQLQKILTKINEEARNKILKDRGIIK